MGLILQLLILLLIGAVFSVTCLLAVFLVMGIMLAILEFTDSLLRNCKVHHYIVLAVKTIGYTTLATLFLIIMGIAGLEKIVEIFR